MIRMDPKVKAALADAGAVYVRTGRHHIYRLPNGRNVVLSISPSDNYAIAQQLRTLRKVQAIAA